jgi:hypothetical protein
MVLTEVRNISKLAPKRTGEQHISAEQIFTHIYGCEPLSLYTRQKKACAVADEQAILTLQIFLNRSAKSFVGNKKATKSNDAAVFYSY